MNNARITPYRPPVISPGPAVEKPPQREERPETITGPKRPELKATAETKAAQINPLGALFDHGQKPSTVRRNINQPPNGQPVRGRFVDVLA